ncbi:MAG: hypothetical protein KDK91_15450, partial [Gammaproteobacteria bacterium]|nr:hypothetical protein [Gammaproteobacteria bacterium]
MVVDRILRLGRLLRPRHVLLVGAGEGGRGSAAIARDCCERLGYQGSLWSVSAASPAGDARGDGNPEPIGLSQALARLPATPEVAFVELEQHAAVQAVRELAAAGVAATVCPGIGPRSLDEGVLGFDEVGDIGTSLAQMLRRAAGDMPVLGAGSCGLINFLDGV